MEFVPCDYAVKKVLPAVRGEVARLLHGKGWTQQNIASALGLSQAAVSKHLSARHPAARPVKVIARALLDKILSKPGKVEIKLCKACEGRGLMICELNKK